MFARIILIGLCIVTAGLYARVLLPPEKATATTVEPDAIPQSEQTVQALPEEQMQLVIQALAPEMTERNRNN